MLKVLLVDDDVEFTEVASHIIEFLGHDICIANCLQEAYEWLENNTFDHILLDFMLPDGSGLHLIRNSIKQESHTKTENSWTDFDKDFNYLDSRIVFKVRMTPPFFLA